MHPTRILSVIGTMLLAAAATAAVIDDSATRVQTTLNPELKRIGTLIPKRVDRIGTSRWMLGCETLDREYADFDSYKDYLSALGIRRIRLQGGWARTEKDPGVHDFAWLDHIIDAARERGLEVMLETSYGNPAYPGGGGRTLSRGFPSSPEGLAAWDRWVEAMATRYKGKVRDWGMWNEPDGCKTHTPEMVTDFNIRTATIIKGIIPDARIGGLVLCWPRPAFIEHFMKTLAEQGKLDLFTWVVYHTYANNPDAVYPAVEKARTIIRTYSPTMRMFQGESGTHSEYAVAGALCRHPWTELTQAKWDTRRMLGDIGHDTDSAVFTAADLDYRTTQGHNGLLRYGLIKTAGMDDGFRVLKVKMSYYAVQNVISVFNDALTLLPDQVIEAQCAKPVAAYGFKDATGRQVWAFWDRSGTPSDRNETLPATLTIPGVAFTEPVWVDIITGGVFAIPANHVMTEGGKTIFRDIALYDAPIIIGEKTSFQFQTAAFDLPHQ